MLHLLFLFVALAFGQVDFRRFLSARPEGAPATFDCAVRKYAFEYAQRLQPFLTKDQKQTVFDALQLAPLCGQKFTKSLLPGQELPLMKPPRGSTLFYVDADVGHDANPGTLNKPFQTIQRAILDSRKISGHRSILLREGTFYLDATLELDSRDSDLLIMAHNGEKVEISGGIPLKISSWQPYQVDKTETIQLVPNANNVFHRTNVGQNTTTIRFLGVFETSQQCQSACLSYQEGPNSCHAYTFFPAGNQAWSNGCYAEITYVWGPQIDGSTAISGRRVRKNVYKTDLSSQSGLMDIPGLRINGRRATRARYPNADPEVNFYPDGWNQITKSFTPPRPSPPAATVHVDFPNRNDVTKMFGEYSMGVGGPCSIFSPPESYWCSSLNSGGGAAVFEMISGLNYMPGTFQNRNLTFDKSLVHLFHWAHWALWVFEVDQSNFQQNTLGWTKGGFQGARGSAGRGGSDWYIENIFEEVDSQNEYFFDTKTKTLYYFNNGTAAPSTINFVATNLKMLVNVQGSQDDPVKNLIFRGITFRDSAYTFMDPHGVPSGGDWAMQKSGGLTFRGTENAMVDSCILDRLDGNGVAILGYNRNMTIQKSEFSWTGDSPIMSWGDTQGIDGTDGNQPRQNQIINNLFREFGIWEKQASPYFQAKSCLNLIKGNIAFNGPRALINFNDGFGGGNEMTQNLLFNANRETSDQGPFNSWDRIPFLTQVYNGTPTLTPAFNRLHHNFMIGNYGSNMCIDNDDGSSYYMNHHNFEVYGGHKSDFGGHDKFTFGAINAYSQVYQDGVCAWYNPDWVVGHNDGYWENKCIQNPTVPYQNIPSCDPNNVDPKTLPVSHSNHIYNSAGSASIQCGNKVFTEAQMQAMGFDPLTNVFPLPSDNTIISWARQLLESRMEEN